MELLSNEYHLVGPFARPMKRNGCSLDCKGRTIDDARKWKSDQRNGERFPRRRPHRGLKLPREETLRTFIADYPEDPIFHSTSIPADERDNADRRIREFNADVPDIRDDRQRRDDYEQIPGPSREFLKIPARNAKKARVEDRLVQRADEKDDDTMTEEDIDCTCGAEVITRDKNSKIRPLDHLRNRRKRRRHDDAEEDREDEAERMKKDDEEGERVEEEDEDAEDSVYEELRARIPHRRTTARERELKRWIRRCRQECERRRER